MFNRHIKIFLFHFLIFFKKKNHINSFKLIYSLNFWIKGSGLGSSIDNTRNYNDFLIQFISKN